MNSFFDLINLLAKFIMTVFQIILNSFFVDDFLHERFVKLCLFSWIYVHNSLSLMEVISFLIVACISCSLLIQRSSQIILVVIQTPSFHWTIACRKNLLNLFPFLFNYVKSVAVSAGTDLKCASAVEKHLKQTNSTSFHSQTVDILFVYFESIVKLTFLYKSYTSYFIEFLIYLFSCMIAYWSQILHYLEHCNFVCWVFPIVKRMFLNRV